MNSSRTCTVHVDGVIVEVPIGANVVAALVAAARYRTRVSTSGEMRFALCGIGMCQECRVTIDGTPQRLACKTLCQAGMNVVTGGR